MRPTIKLIGPARTDIAPIRKSMRLRIVSAVLGSLNSSPSFGAVALNTKFNRAYRKMLSISAVAGHAIRMIGITILFFLMIGC
jgi:hypothetical protein